MNTMTAAQISHIFRFGVQLDDGHFSPVVFIKSVEEPDFGCEGRDENTTAEGKVVLITADGIHQVKIPEAAIYDSHIDDCLWIGTLKCTDGPEKLVSLNYNQLNYQIMDKKWLSLLLPEKPQEREPRKR